MYKLLRLPILIAISSGCDTAGSHQRQDQHRAQNRAEDFSALLFLRRLALGLGRLLPGLAVGLPLGRRLPRLGRILIILRLNL